MEIQSVRGADGTKLRVLHWDPASEMTNPVGEAVLIVHGLAEHAGRYAHVADALTRAGER